jgi:hypothetical protein
LQRQQTNLWPVPMRDDHVTLAGDGRNRPLDRLLNISPLGFAIRGLSAAKQGIAAKRYDDAH